MIMKKYAIIKIISKIIVLIAIGLLCWPSISHISSAYKVMQLTEDYETEVEALDEKDYTDLIESARRYNDSLVGSPVHDLTDEEMEQYMSLMNITGNGIMGRISIPKINVDLPIYHGDKEDSMQRGAGHMPGTSLPVVSASSHVVISGHSGLATKPMFIDLGRLEIGDTFQISALRQVITYEVDQILTVLPEEVDAIAIEPGKEYCTLVTCTPMWINNHRLLVRGHRIESPEASEGDKASDADKTTVAVTDIMLRVLYGKVLAVHEVVMLLIALILLVVEIIWPCAKAIRKKLAEMNDTYF